MNTITDVLLELIRLAPVREESQFSKMAAIVESAREKLDAAVHSVAETVETAQADAVKDAAPVAPQAPSGPVSDSATGTTVSGL